VLPPAGEGWTEKEVVGEAAPIINYVEYELVVMLTVVTHAVNSVKLMEDIDGGGVIVSGKRRL
jgi:hypothetical protein